MVPDLDIESLNVLGKVISKLERFYLENAVPEEFDPGDLLDESEQVFFCIQGLANFWSHNPQVDFGQYMADVIVGAHNQHQADLTMIVLGTASRLAAYISLGTEQTTRTIMEGIFPEIRLEPIGIKELRRLLAIHLKSKGVITGIPSNKGFSSSQMSSLPSENGGQSPHGSQLQTSSLNPTKLEHVIRGMYGATWGYIVQAHPRQRPKVVEERMKTIDLLSQVTRRSRTQWQSSKQQFTASESGGTSQTFSSEVVNYRAQYLTNLLQRELERLDQGMAAGQWLVRTCFGASEESDSRRLASLLLGILAGADSRPEPLRASFCQGGGASLDQFQTFLTSQEVNTLIQLPREEVPGYALHDCVRFDVDFRTSDPHLSQGAAAFVNKQELNASVLQQAAQEMAEPKQELSPGQQLAEYERLCGQQAARIERLEQECALLKKALHLLPSKS